MVRRGILYSLIGAFMLSMPVFVLHAQSQKEWRETESKQATIPKNTTPHYEGVTPGSGNNLPKVEELKTKPGTWVTWPGFRMLSNGASQIFLQTTGSVKYDLVEQKMKLILKMKDASVHLSNNRNPLVTTHFNTPVRRTYLKRKKRAGVELIVEFKQPCTYQISQRFDADEYHYLFIDFAAGAYPVEDSTSSRPSYEGYGTRADESDDESPSPDDESETFTNP